MKQMRKIFSALLIITTVILLFSSCKSDGSGADIWYPMDGEVNTLDPQCASTADELLIILNSMEGLVRIDKDGTVVPGMAESWTVSEDGRVYTFRLREGLKWDLTETQKNIYKPKDEEESTTQKSKKKKGEEDVPTYPIFNPDITAADFVFALQRASLPNTNAPYFNSISAIENAVAIHSGMADVSSLGVTAPDAQTLQIRLNAPDAQFLNTLASAIAMPCNQEFFEFTEGRYGLEKNNTLFNGPFYLYSWGSSKVILRKSEIYQKADKPAVSLPLPSAITLTAPSDRSTVLPNLLKGVYDAALITGKESKTLTEKDGVTLTPYERTIWGYLFNCAEGTPMSNENIRKAVCAALQPIKELNEAYLSLPKGIVPQSCNINERPYRDLAGEAAISAADAEKAVSLWLAGLKELSPSELNLTILCTEEMADYVKQSVQGLQKTLGNKVNYLNKNNVDTTVALTIKIETVSEADFEDKLETGSFQIAFYPLEAADDSALNFLSQFAQGGGYTGYESAAYDKLISDAEETRDANTEASLLKQCEEELLSHAVVYPVLSEANYFAMAKGVSDIRFSTSGGKIDFMYGKRND